MIARVAGAAMPVLRSGAKNSADDGRGFVSYNEPSYLAQRYGLTDDEADGLRVVETIARTMRNTA